MALCKTDKQFVGFLVIFLWGCVCLIWKKRKYYFKTKTVGGSKSLIGWVIGCIYIFPQHKADYSAMWREQSDFTVGKYLDNQQLPVRFWSAHPTDTLQFHETTKENLWMAAKQCNWHWYECITSWFLVLNLQLNVPYWLGLGTETLYKYGTATYVTGMY